MNTISARGITKSYGQRPALRHVNLDVEGGAIMCLLGASGSGKTTLVRHLHLLERPDSGYVTMDGGPTLAGDLPSIRRCALVQQRPGILRGTVLDNVAFPRRARGGPRHDAEAVAASWLARLGLGDRFEESPIRLSGGETQRIAIARALACTPDFLFIDEGTNQLDPAWVRTVEGLVRAEAARGAAILWVTHNVQQAFRMADRFVFLDGGSVREAGGRDQLRAPQTPELGLFMETG